MKIALTNSSLLKRNDFNSLAASQVFSSGDMTLDGK